MERRRRGAGAAHAMGADVAEAVLVGLHAPHEPLLPLARRRALVLDAGRAHGDRRQRRVLRKRRSGETARKRER